MIKGWTTDPNANEAYRPSSRTASYGTKQRLSSPEYHPESAHHAGDQESADSETEEYRFRLIVLPGGQEKTGTDSMAESDEKEPKPSGDDEETLVHKDINNNTREENADTEAEEVDKPSSEEENNL